MHSANLLKNSLPYLLVSFMFVICGFCVFYILSNTLWADKVLPNTSIMGIDVSLNEKEQLLKVYETHFYLPQTVKIKVGELERELDLEKIDAVYSPSPQEIIDSGRYEIGKMIENIDLLYKKKEFIPVIVFDETKLDNWVTQNFKELELETFKLPVIKKNELGEIESCEEGNEGGKIPYDQIRHGLRNLKTDSLQFQIDKVDFQTSENLISKVCKELNFFSEKIAFFEDQRIFEYWEVKDYFIFTESSGNLQISIKNELLLKTKIAQLGLSLDQSEILPEMKVVQDTVYLLGEYRPYRRLDIEATLSNLKNQLTNPLSVFEFKLLFETSGIPEALAGKAVKDYSKLISSGYGKFKNERSREKNIASITKGLMVLDGKIISNNSEYSMIRDGLEARIANGNNWLTTGNYSYNIGICAVATAMYRAALEAGLPITERHPHQQALAAYTYPYGGIVDAALYFNANNKQDLKFRNDYDFDMLIVTQARVENEEFNYNIRLFAPAGSIGRKVVIKDFQRDKQWKNTGFNEKFTRYVNGKSEIIQTKYYSSNF